MAAGCGGAGRGAGGVGNLIAFGGSVGAAAGTGALGAGAVFGRDKPGFGSCAVGATGTFGTALIDGAGAAGAAGAAFWKVVSGIPAGEAGMTLQLLRKIRRHADGLRRSFGSFRAPFFGGSRCSSAGRRSARGWLEFRFINNANAGQPFSFAAKQIGDFIGNGNTVLSRSAGQKLPGEVD